MDNRVMAYEDITEKLKLFLNSNVLFLVGFISILYKDKLYAYS